MTFKIPTLILALFAGSGFAAPNPKAPSISVGQTLPELSLPRISDGKLISTKSIVGKRYIVHLFASW
jgi:hypothetical protein